MFTFYRFQTFLSALAVFVAVSSFAMGDDRFAIAMGPHDTLVVFGPKGEQVAEILAPSIDKMVTVGTTTFQISYGRDANDLLTAILAPNSSDPQDLHFNVLNKSVDANKQAVVTLTFRDPDHVTIDPGYVGTVAVDSHVIKHHDLADTNYTPPVPPRSTSSSGAVPHATSNAQPKVIPPPVSHEPAHAPSIASESTSSLSNVPVRAGSPDVIPPLSGHVPSVDVTGNSGGPIASAPMVGSLQAQPPPDYALNISSTASVETKQRLYWSEPITPPNGPPPSVSPSEMKLVEVQGPVSIKLANGDTKPGENGMILPSGSTILTSDDASAAVFMGGVNSARLLPDTEAKITQNLDGSVRHTSIDLHQGTVFSRVGRRSGETEDYEVRTPEGVAAARGTELADHRGIGSDGKYHHYVYVAKGIVETFVADQLAKTITGTGGNVGSTAMPPSDDTDQILQAILIALQPFNGKLAGVLERIQAGTASPGDLAFYNALVNTFFGEELPALIKEYEDYPNPSQGIIPAARRALNQLFPNLGPPELSPN